MFINILNILKEIKEVSYTDKDVRASWVGPGPASTDCFDYLNLAKWANEHLHMYEGFYNEINRTSGKIMDIGCGAGFATINLLNNFSNFKINAIDFDEKCINFANKYNSHKNINYINNDIFICEIKDKFDYIFALEILEHLPAEHHYSFIDLCLSYLKDDGKLFITTPNAKKESDGDFSHIGLLNNKRFDSFYFKYFENILELNFYDSKQFIVHDPPLSYMEGDKSHFRIVLVKQRDLKN